MAITEAYTASATIGTTEYSIAAASTTLATIASAGCYQLFIDFDALAIGDTFEVYFYEKVLSTSTKKKVATYTIGLDLGSTPNVVFPAMFLLNGWDMTVKKLVGTDRAIEASIRKST